MRVYFYSCIELFKIQSLKENSEPIYKIDKSTEKVKAGDDVSLLVKDSSESLEDNEHDLKDENSEE